MTCKLKQVSGLTQNLISSDRSLWWYRPKWFHSSNAEATKGEVLSGETKAVFNLQEVKNSSKQKLGRKKKSIQENHVLKIKHGVAHQGSSPGSLVIWRHVT